MIHCNTAWAKHYAPVSMAIMTLQRRSGCIGEAGGGNTPTAAEAVRTAKGEGTSPAKFGRWIRHRLPEQAMHSTPSMHPRDGRGRDKTEPIVEGFASEHMYIAKVIKRIKPTRDSSHVEGTVVRAARRTARPLGTYPPRYLPHRYPAETQWG